MTTILSDDFTTLANWTGSGSLVAGRTGNGMQVSGSGTSTYTIPAGPLRTNGQTAQFSYRINSLVANRPICSFIEAGANNQVTLRATTTGALAALLGGTTGSVIGTTAAGIIAINTWYTIEIAVHIANAPDGAVRVKLDTVTVLNLTGVDTYISGSTSLDTLTLRGGGSGTTPIFDDFLLTTDDPTTGANVKAWNGTAFVDAPVKIYNGTAFVDAVAVKTYNGSAFV